MIKEKEYKPNLYNDHFQNYKRYNVPKAQLIIADIPYNLGNKAYASNPSWYEGGDNKNGESNLAIIITVGRSCQLNSRPLINIYYEFKQKKGVRHATV